jgi:hypothetical protein
VYERRLAPPNRFDQRIYDLELSKVTVTVAHHSRLSMESIRTVLAEMLLQEAIANPPLWKRAPPAMWTFVALPAVKWVFGVLSAVVIAALTYVLGVK